jgi:predicted nucleic acid-binding protein
MFVLDTNHVSELTCRTSAGSRLLQRLEATQLDAAVSAITVEESLRAGSRRSGGNPSPEIRLPPTND